MAYDTQQRDDIISFLDGTPVNASEFCLASLIKANTLNNYLTKTNLELCSEKPGRGKARNFCLIDCYELVLLDKLVKRIKDYEVAAMAVNEMTYEIPRQLMMAGQQSFKTDRDMKSAFCRSAFNAMPEYWMRDFENPFFYMEKGGEWLSVEAKNIREHLEVSDDGAIVFNVTGIFRKFELDLARIKGFPLEDYNRRKTRKMVLTAFADAIRPPPEDSTDDHS